jgi:hypothetical protein
LSIVWNHFSGAVKFSVLKVSDEQSSVDKSQNSVSVGLIVFVLALKFSSVVELESNKKSLVEECLTFFNIIAKYNWLYQSYYKTVKSIVEKYLTLLLNLRNTWLDFDKGEKKKCGKKY